MLTDGGICVNTSETNSQYYATLYWQHLKNFYSKITTPGPFNKKSYKISIYIFVLFKVPKSHT